LSSVVAGTMTLPCESVFTLSQYGSPSGRSEDQYACAEVVSSISAT